MKIGVFDSGVGGLSVAKAIQKAMPELEVVFRNDREHVPYGNREPDEILGFVQPIFERMTSEGCEVIIIACNTVTTTLAPALRKLFTTPLIGIEPMIKPAAAYTKSGVIAVCATPATLSSARYAYLLETYAKKIKVLQPDCSDWSAMIEHNKIDDAKITGRIGEVLDEGADVIVLGCTHYHWIEDKIVELAGDRAVVLQPEQAIIRRLQAVLRRLQ